MDPEEINQLVMELSKRIHRYRPLEDIRPLIQHGCIAPDRLHPEIARAIVAAADLRRLDLLELFLAYPTAQRDLDEAFTYACFHWHADAVRLLLQVGADIRTHHEIFGTPLIALAREHGPGRDMSEGRAAIHLLIEHGADVNAVDTMGKSVLYSLLYHNGSACPLVPALIAAGADVGPIEAALLGDVERLEALLTDPKNHTILLATWTEWIGRAAADGHLDVLKRILALVGEERSLLAAICMREAAYGGQVAVYRFLLPYGTPPTPYYAKEYLLVSIREGYTDMIRFWLDEFGLDLHTRGVGPAFRTACDSNTHVETLRLLLERADKECLIQWDLPAALGYAAKNGSVETVKFLLAFGVEVNRFHDGHTPLMSAVRSGHVEVVRLLLEAGADKQAKSKRGGQTYSVAAYAQFCGNAEIQQMLR